MKLNTMASACLHAIARRREALSRARSAVESNRFRALLLDAAAWTEAGDWISNADELTRALRDQPIGIVATAEMERRRRKVLKRGARLAELDPARRHRVRIQAKKLRYASEFFGSAFSGTKAARRRKELIATLKQFAGQAR
jgi:triphosphatase